MKTYIISIILFFKSVLCVLGQCGILSENPETIILTGIITDDISYNNKVIVIGENQNVLFEGNIDLVNCKVIFNKLLLYKQPEAGFKTLRFSSCRLEFDEGSAIRSHNGFNAQRVQIDIENSCLTGNRPTELLHVEEGGLRFVNNTTNITNTAHMFHLVNLDQTLINEIYGNTINITIDQHLIDILDDPVILVDRRFGSLKIGNNNHSPNIITTNAMGLRFFNVAPNDEVIIENTVFNSPLVGINVSRSVEKLLIDNCVFNGTSPVAKGISYSRDGYANDLNITNSTFSTSAIGIDLPRSRNVIIENNTFNHLNTGIFKGFSNQSFADGEILNNQFINGEIDIHSTGAWNHLKIENNNFSGEQFGILADGDNKYVINNNSFYNSYAGSILYSNGDNENSHYQNQFNTIVGIHSLNENAGYEFIDNCFASIGGDVYIDGSTLPMIGEDSREAGNCFTKQNIPDITATGQTFEYYRPDSKINTCNDPITQSNYVEKNGDDIQEGDCGPGLPFSGTVNNYCNFNPKTLTCSDAKALYAQILQQINTILSTSYSNPVLKSYLILRLSLCRSRLLKKMMGCLGDDPAGPKMGDGSFIHPKDGFLAANELKNSVNKYEQAAYIGLSVELGMLEEAMDFITTMVTTDEEMMDFIEVQDLNIQYIQQKDTFMLTPSDSVMLVNKGQKVFPLAAYARGLYYQLTGLIMYPDIPVISFNRSKRSEIHNKYLFPNPFNDYLLVKCEESVYLRITDIAGKIMMEQNIQPGNTNVETMTWSPGMYIVNLQSKDGSNESYKVIKQ